jgi:hypothetical protein
LPKENLLFLHFHGFAVTLSGLAKGHISPGGFTCAVLQRIRSGGTIRLRWMPCICGNLDS